MYIHMQMMKKEGGIKRRAYVGSVIKIVILLVAFSAIMVGIASADGLSEGQGVILSCNATGTEKNVFSAGETVYVIGYGLAPDNAVDVYVVNYKNPMYYDGEPIGPYIVKKSTSSSEVEHVLALGVVGNAPGQIPCPGEYDIVYDKNQDGYWNESVDLIDYKACIGFVTIPIPKEVPVGTAVPVGIALIIIALVIFRRRRFSK